MSEQSNNNQQTLVIGLAVIAVLLVAIIGVMMFRANASTNLPEPVATAAVAGAVAGANTGAPTDPGAAAPAQVDPKTAVKLAKGTTPEQWTEQYYKACDSGDWATAVKRLPADKQASTTADSLKEQVGGYGIVGYKISSSSEQGDQAIIVVDQETSQYGTFENTWTFAKTDGEWVVVSKAVTGMK
jgi:hypothetical protein